MPHRPEPFYRAPRRTWVLQIGKQQIRLGRDNNPRKDSEGNFVPPDDVMRKFHELMARKPEARPAPKVVEKPVLVVEILDEFLDWTLKHREARTAEWYQRHLQEFASAVGRALKVSDLRPFHITRISDGRDDWSPTTKHGFARAVQRALKWAEDQGLIAVTPLRKVEKPTPESKDVVISEAEYRTILEVVKEPNFRDLLIVAWETGARPRELRIAEARHVDAAHSRLVFPIKKAKGKKRPRVVYLPPNALAIVERYRASHPTGPLFRNSDGKPWHRYAINCAFIRLEKKIGRKLHLGAFRHTFGDQALKNDVDPITVANLMGHRNLAMLANTYSHLNQDPEYLLEAAKKAKS
jgi:integrase